MQVFCFSNGEAIHLFERDRSLQRRFQKAHFLDERESQLVLAEQELERQKKLYTTKTTSEGELQRREAARRSAVANLASIQAQIEQAEFNLKGEQANLSFTKIYAPLAGTIVAMPVGQGQPVSTMQLAPQIVTIAD